MMSLRRGGVRGRRYQDRASGYMASAAWRRRRRQFLAYRQQSDRDGVLRCQCCTEELTDRSADVHHLSYEDMGQREDGSWFSRERNEDLMVLCRWCHERVHTLMDQDRGWSRMPRREATAAIVQVIQQRLIGMGLEVLHTRGEGEMQRVV